MTAHLVFATMKRSLTLAVLLLPCLSLFANHKSLARPPQAPLTREERQVVCQEALPTSQREAQQHPHGWSQQETLARDLLCAGYPEGAIAVIRAMPDLFPSYKAQSYSLLAEALYAQNPDQPEVLSAFLAAFESDFQLKKLSTIEKWALAYLWLGNLHQDRAKQDPSYRDSSLPAAKQLTRTRWTIIPKTQRSICN
ncbi:MAG: hypothetical protein HC810_08430 [Acaryochloridaceae cyanobacterium RL_2_7]|nr:hypothetical protein [Acaryochloridaceae cyanobacterium RL_2_7]